MGFTFTPDFIIAYLATIDSSQVSVPGTPARSRPASRPTSRATSPTRSSHRSLRVPLQFTSISGRSPRDPLRAFPTDLSQRIFSQLSIKELARCARVSKKWSKSQTLNYGTDLPSISYNLFYLLMHNLVWFQHYRKDNFHDDTLPPGKWTKRESKQNWRTSYLYNAASRERSPTTYSRPLSPAATSSGYQTPREIREEKWKVDGEAQSKPTKIEMREMYKELGGRKAKAKSKFGASGSRDKGGWGDDSGGFDDL